MTAKTPAQRQADLIARRKAAGLFWLKLWVHPQDVAEMREMAAKLAKRRAKIKTGD